MLGSGLGAQRAAAPSDRLNRFKAVSRACFVLRRDVKSLFGQMPTARASTPCGEGSRVGGMGKDMAPQRAPAVPRRPTILDIANEAGVSKGLVSMALSGASGPSAATTERVLAIAERLGYRTNRTAALLARRRTQLLGVTIIPSNVYHGELIEEIQATADATGYELVLGSIAGSRDERRTIEMLIDFRCEALLLVGPTMSADKLAPLIAGTPTVSVGRPLLTSMRSGPTTARASTPSPITWSPSATGASPTWTAGPASSPMSADAPTAPP